MSQDPNPELEPLSQGATFSLFLKTKASLWFTKQVAKISGLKKKSSNRADLGVKIGHLSLWRLSKRVAEAGGGWLPLNGKLIIILAMLMLTEE